MALKIRLRQQGRNNGQVYRLVVTDVRHPRGGQYVEALGWYNPFIAEVDKAMSFKQDRIQHWLDQGAQLTDSAGSLIKKVAPTLIEKHNAKALASRNKERMKRRARNKKAEG